MSILDEADELRTRRKEEGMEEKPPLHFEIARFFLALKETLEEKHQLLPYMRNQIYKDVETRYLTTTDEEVNKYLKV